MIGQESQVRKYFARPNFLICDAVRCDRIGRQGSPAHLICKRGHEMKLRDINWRLVILTSVSVAVGINVLILLLMLLVFYFEIFSARQVIAISRFFIFFPLFSPLIASLVSCGIVTFFSTQKKLLHTIFSTILTFLLTLLILATVTVYVGGEIYASFDRRANLCFYENCSE